MTWGGGYLTEGGEESCFENSLKGDLGQKREPTMPSVREQDRMPPRQKQVWASSAAEEWGALLWLENGATEGADQGEAVISVNLPPMSSHQAEHVWVSAFYLLPANCLLLLS